MNELISASGGEMQQSLPDEEQRLAIESRCMALLAKRAARYTLGEDTSLPEETALRLLRSLRYVVEQCGLSPAELAEADWNKLYERGISCLQAKLEQGRRLYLAAHEALPPLSNRSLRETMEAIGGFFRQYDVYYFAAEIPCDIDYQLCRPVPESLCGVDYINEYLRRILIESDFLRRFSPAVLTAFLGRESPDWRELILNLYEPVAAMAVGLVLADEEPESLALIERGRQRIAERFSHLQKAEADRALLEAADTLAKRLGISLPEGADYLRFAAGELRPRIMAALGRQQSRS